jgi:hypothetical protein
MTTAKNIEPSDGYGLDMVIAVLCQRGHMTIEALLTTCEAATPNPVHRGRDMCSVGSSRILALTTLPTYPLYF